MLDLEKSSIYGMIWSMRELIFGILGFGKMGKIRYNTLNAMPRCKVSWICDINSVTQVPEDVHYTRDPEDILQDKDVGAIVVSTSNDSLKDLVVAGLDQGKHVFCEKPPGRNLVEINEMIGAEKRNPQMKLMYGFNHRHHKSILRAKELIDSGEFGQVLWMRGRYGKSVNDDFFSSWRSEKKRSGGGIFLDQGIHMLDLLLMMCGNFDEVKAYVSRLYWDLDIEDNVFAIFRNKKGQVASLHSTITQWRHLFSLEIFLERGYITINGLRTSSNTYGNEVLTIAKNRTLPPAAMWSEEKKIVYHVDNSWERELGIFVDAIRNDTDIPVGNSKDALKVMKLVEKVYNEQ